MKTILSIFFTILFCSSISFAQETTKVPCPDALSVVVPKEQFKPGFSFKPSVSYDFTAKVNNPGKLKLEYNWTITGAIIISGQGTEISTIVQTADMEGAKLSVSVTAFAPGTDCGELTSTKIDMICECLFDTIFDQISFPLPGDYNQKLDKLADYLAANPNARVSLLGRVSESGSEPKVKTAISHIIDYLMNERRIDSLRIKSSLRSKSDGEPEQIVVWVVPTAAVPFHN